jgi:hypothetical protein
MGGTDSRPTSIKPEGAVAMVDACIDLPEASCRGSQADERRKYSGKLWQASDSSVVVPRATGC